MENIRYEKINDVYIYYLSGEIDETNADNINKYIFSTFSGIKVIYDLGGLNYINSKFLGCLYEMFENTEKKSGIMYIVNCSKNIEDILDMAGIFKIILSANTKEEALEKMK
ncbi:anti-sigma factor antagonist [Candidatus Gracilibacteria bacterium]|nr:anti-sigma factor antagonist [Candidatus Gracilibacteria bacterium]